MDSDARESQAEGLPRAGPEGMRELVHDYVHAVHTTYLDHVRHLPPGERGMLPLVAAARLRVVAAAARRLHLVATTDSLPARQGPEVELTDEHHGVTWAVRFYDPSVLPQLGLLPDDSPADVRRVLGIGDTVYHLTVDIGGGLSSHHASHSGVALANQHSRAVSDLQRLRHALPRQARLVDELGVCVRNGLDRAAALLAAELTDGRVDSRGDLDAVGSLRAVLAEVVR